jgi:hypothetical protein
LVLLLSYDVVARRYFFRFPFRSVLLATVLYTLALVLAWT